MTRRGGKATVSCDLKSAQPLSTVANDPGSYKAAESVAVAWVNEGKKGVRIEIDVVYDLNEEDDLVEDDDAGTVVLVVKKARKVSFELPSPRHCSATETDQLPDRCQFVAWGGTRTRRFQWYQYSGFDQRLQM